MDQFARDKVVTELGKALEGLQTLPLSESMQAMGRCAAINSYLKLPNPVPLEPAVYKEMASELREFAVAFSDRLTPETKSALEGAANVFGSQVSKPGQELQVSAEAPKPKQEPKRNLGNIVGEAFTPPVRGKRVD
jgi:hypothetical protein